MKKKQRFEERHYFVKVHHQPTYTAILKEYLDGSPLSRNPPPNFTSSNPVQSQKSTKRLSNCINWLLIFADKKRVYEKKTKKTFSFRLAFITLTLSAAQVHEDSYIKEHLLQPFLYWISRYYQCNYVWKAETQLNGNIHFHITIDTFIHWKSIRAKWNQLLASHGYCKVFQDGTNDKGNASTQIKTVLKELEVAKYLAAYLSKKNIYNKKKHGSLFRPDGNPRDTVLCCPYPKPENHQRDDAYLRTIEGRVWGCSENISKVQCIMSQIDLSGTDFYNEEHIFFHENSGVQNLGKLLMKKEEDRMKKAGLEIGFAEQEQLHRKFFHMENVYLHRNLLTMKKGTILQSRLAELKLQKQKNTQTHFTVESLSES